LEPEAGRDVGAKARKEESKVPSIERTNSTPVEPSAGADAPGLPQAQSATAPRVLRDVSPAGNREKTEKEKKRNKKKIGSTKGEPKVPVSGVGQRDRSRVANTNNSNLDPIRNPRDVPMGIKDRRLPIEIVLDQMIDDTPSLRHLTAFEPSSLLDWIDMISITRREAFRSFPSNTPLPTVPDTLRIKVLDAFKEALDTARINMPLPVGPFVLSEGEKLLAKALEIESRRADLLEHQATMLRSELVTALKRWEVFIAVLLPEVPEPKDVTEELSQVYKQRLRSLHSLTSLSGTKQVIVSREHAEVMNAYRNRRKKVHRRTSRGGAETGQGGGAAEAASASSSDAESSLWSSSSEEEDD
jgi:hypothetical protein